MFIKLKKFLFKKTPTFLIDTSSKFDEALNELLSEKLVGIDTEFDWRNTYYPKLSLIQISTRKKIFLIDCLKLDSIFKLKEVFENNGIIKVFHAVRSDVTVLSCSADLKVTNCFDIQVAEKFFSKDDLKSYANIVSKYLNLNIDKSETNSNWLRRPFTQSQMKYAANDVRYLIKIYDKQKKALEKINSYSLVIDLIKKEVSLGAQKLHVSRIKKFKFKNKKDKDLFMWRETKAIERNVPPSYIFKNKHFKKILEIYNENFLKEDILKILKNENLANDFIKTFR